MTLATALALLTVASAMAQLPPPQQVDPRTLGSIEGVTLGANHQPLADTTVMMLGAARPLPGGGMFARHTTPHRILSADFRFRVSPPAGMHSRQTTPITLQWTWALSQAGSITA